MTEEAFYRVEGG